MATAAAATAPITLEQANALLASFQKVNAEATQINERTQQMLSGQSAPAYVKAVNHEKPFSFHRFMAFLATEDKNVAPHETEVIDRYKKCLERTGCGLGQQQTLLGHWLPTNLAETYGGALTQSSEAEKDYRYVKAVFEASRPQYDPDEAGWLLRNRYVKAAIPTDQQSAYVDSIGGSLVPPPVQGAPIPLIRPQAAFLAAGAQAMTLPPNGRWVAPRITSPPDARAVGESQDTPVSQLGTGQMELTAKKIAGAVTLTEEATAFTSGTMDTIAQSELGRSLGLKLDAYAFYGPGGSQIPSGLTSNAYAAQIINIETDYASAKGIGINGNTLLPQYGDVFPALIGERSFNMDATTGTWIMRPGAFATALMLRADAVTANDQAGPMVDILRRFAEAGPGVFKGRRVVQSTNISKSYTKGSGTNLTDVFFGIWQYAIFASYGALQFQQGHNANTFLRGQVLIRGTMYGDVGFQYPTAFLWYPNVLGLSSNF